MVPLKRVTAVDGYRAQVPCHLREDIQGNPPYLVLWFKEEDSDMPIYTFDARMRSTEDGRHRVAPFLQPRAHLSYLDGVPHLTFDPVRYTDEGLYRCRADYRRAPTSYFNVNLTIVIPPPQPTIREISGLQVGSTAGPVDEGSDLHLTCEVDGGKPMPRVTWWWENRLLNSSDESVSPGVVRSHLHLYNVERKHLMTSLTCQAANTNLTVPEYRSIKIEMNLPPLEVKVEGPKGFLSSGKAYDFQCRVIGSRPAAFIRWWKNGQSLSGPNYITTESDGNVTKSVLTLTVNREDHGKSLDCRAHNPKMSAVPDVHASAILHVTYPPAVNVRFGANLNPEWIKVGDDVYFECNVDANPKFHSLKWLHDGKELSHDPKMGVIVTESTLVIRGIQRRHAGKYECLAENSLGRSNSSPLSLQVQHAPECKPQQASIYGVAPYERINITCDVEANPDTVRFHWRFNSSSAQLTEFPAQDYWSAGTRSTLIYTPRTPMDFGTVVCWASNPVGNQQVPCTFHVVEAGHPDPVSNCSIQNQTDNTFYVECLPGFDGGLKQFFHMDVFDSDTMELKANRTTPIPRFTVKGLEEDLSLLVYVYASNARGKSPITSLEARTPRVMENKMDKEEGRGLTLALTPLVMLLAGGIGAIVLTTAIVLIFLVLRRRQRRSRSRSPQHKHTISEGKRNLNSDPPSDEKNPDIISNINPQGDGNEGSFSAVPLFKNEASASTGFPVSPAEWPLPPGELRTTQGEGLLYTDLTVPRRRSGRSPAQDHMLHHLYQQQQHPATSSPGSVFFAGPDYLQTFEASISKCSGIQLDHTESVV
ncbi:unnamed protein product [Darwinula stevensoni]|uniref:Ig-like domain-containing protein n=1 Tax=Darwinula stevensoni TaxID=69355 RepID=A0A7R8WYH9_9CRUS|nr:unnamed protein product [Darwinula stevensoni]CAG0879414.1 unnamed protein product [Darwinula stevensoni]